MDHEDTEHLFAELALEIGCEVVQETSGRKSYARRTVPASQPGEPEPGSSEIARSPDAGSRDDKTPTRWYPKGYGVYIG